MCRPFESLNQILDAIVVEPERQPHGTRASNKWFALSLAGKPQSRPQKVINSGFQGAGPGPAHLPLQGFGHILAEGQSVSHIMMNLISAS